MNITSLNYIRNGLLKVWGCLENMFNSSEHRGYP